MEIAIDTNTLIEIEKNNKDVISKIDKLELNGAEICITSPTYSEYYLGLMKLSLEKKEKGRQRLDKYKILNTTRNSSKLLGEIKYTLSKAGTPTPVFDLFIASIAMDNGAPLVTQDGHFKSIPNLKVIMI